MVVAELPVPPHDRLQDLLTVEKVLNGQPEVQVAEGGPVAHHDEARESGGRCRDHAYIFSVLDLGNRRHGNAEDRVDIAGVECIQPRVVVRNSEKFLFPPYRADPK